MSLADAAAEAEKRKHLFPLTNRIYRLALTAPVTVATNERTFSKLKIVKTALRNSTSDNRLFNLILLSCEKDITDTIDLDAWSTSGQQKRRDVLTCKRLYKCGDR